MRGAALPAGNYLGSLGRYHMPSRGGASMRGHAKLAALSGVGLSGLGAGVDFCDSGWSAVGNLLGATGSLITAQNQSSAAAAKSSTPDRGWGAAGAGASSLSTVWGSTCTNRAAAEGAQQQRDFEQQMAAQALANQRAIAEGQTQAQFLLAQQQQQRGGGINNQTLLIGAGVLGALVLGALLLRK